MSTAPAVSDQVDARQLVVHGRTGIVRIRLTGDPRLDALLERLARRGGGCVILERVPDGEGA